MALQQHCKLLRLCGTDKAEGAIETDSASCLCWLPWEHITAWGVHLCTAAIMIHHTHRTKKDMPAAAGILMQTAALPHGI